MNLGYQCIDEDCKVEANECGDCVDEVESILVAQNWVFDVVCEEELEPESRQHKRLVDHLNYVAQDSHHWSYFQVKSQQNRAQNVGQKDLEHDGRTAEDYDYGEKHSSCQK